VLRAYGTQNYTLPKQVLKNAIWEAALDQTETLWVEMAVTKQARTPADDVSHMIEPNTVPYVTVADTQKNSWTMQVGPRLIRTFEFVSSIRVVSIMPWHF
jgi:hypothetical protein